MSLKFAVTGSTGLIGSAVCDWLTQRGHIVTRIVRPVTRQQSISRTAKWDYLQKSIELDKLEGHDAVVHLAGVNIADQLWTKTYKEQIHASRVRSTSFLCDSLIKLKKPPKMLFSASAVGYYGDQGDNTFVDEGGSSGHGFLAEVTSEWEASTRSAELFGIKVVHMRFGLVLAKNGGALSKMLPAFYCGVGGPIGRGTQGISWINLWEIPAIIHFLAENGQLSGHFNFTAPVPVTSRDFARILGSVIKRPGFIPLPSFMVSLIFGEMGKELLLNGSFIVPRRLLDLGYQFAYPDLKTALIEILK